VFVSSMYNDAIGTNMFTRVRNRKKKKHYIWSWLNIDRRTLVLVLSIYLDIYGSVFISKFLLFFFFLSDRLSKDMCQSIHHFIFCFNLWSVVFFSDLLDLFHHFLSYPLDENRLYKKENNRCTLYKRHNWSGHNKQAVRWEKFDTTTCVLTREM